MINQTLAIARNAFFESIRQPILLVLVLAAMLLLILSNPLSAFTMEDDQKMLLDIGLATVFMAGMLLAAFVAANVLGREIHNRTALTVVSKPVSRPSFVVGKFLGVTAAITLATLAMALVFALVEQQAVLQTVRDPIHVPVIVLGVAAIVLGTTAAVWCNYFYGFVFSSTWICATTPLLAVAYLVTLNFGPNFTPLPMAHAFKPDLWKALLSILVAITVLASIAVAASTRLGQLQTLVVTFLIFFAGMMSDAWFGQPRDRIEMAWLDRATAEGKTVGSEHVRTMEKTNGDIEEVVTEVTVPLTGVNLRAYATDGELAAWAGCHVGAAILPNFQVLWLADALTQHNVIPTRYVVRSGIYGGLYVSGAVCIGIVLFQRREVS